MKVVLRASVVAVLALGYLQIAAAQAANFRHLLSIYVDEKGVGLSGPEGVACGPNGLVIVGDTGNDRLVRFTYQDKTLLGGSEIRAQQLAAPTRVRLNSKGDIYALNSRERRVVHFSPEGEFKDIALTGAPPPSTIVAKSFAIDSADNLYVLDVFSARVLVAGADSTFQRALPFPAGLGFGSDLAVDETGGVLLLDSIKRQLYYAERDAKAFAPLGGALQGILNTLPAAITASKGFIFVTESAGSIVSFHRDGSFLGRSLTPGRVEGSLSQPSQLCINDRNEVFVADGGNSRVQVFQSIR